MAFSITKYGIAGSTITRALIKKQFIRLKNNMRINNFCGKVTHVQKREKHFCALKIQESLDKDQSSSDIKL